jgi:hypothetical protein
MAGIIAESRSGTRAVCHGVKKKTGLGTKQRVHATMTRRDQEKLYSEGRVEFFPKLAINFLFFFVP